MKIELFDRNNEQYRAEAANLLIECFPDSYKDFAHEEMNSYLEEDRIAIMAIHNGHLIGFVGAIPQYGVTGWELHPLVITKEFRKQGIGTELLTRLELECVNRDGITIYLGSDDETNSTSLGNTNLYSDTYSKMKNVRNLKNHPFEFYQKVGYKIVGVIPDANGIGKPDIYMAKRIIKE